MSTIVYVDHSTIRDGKLDELKVAIAELASFIDANEPRLLAYEAFLGEDETEMSVVHVHRDAKSLAYHMDVAGPRFPPFAGLVVMSSIDLYGDVPDDLVERLRQKAELLGSGPVRVHRLAAGFDRF